MSTLQQPGIGSSDLRVAVDRYFQFSLLLLIATGFVTLVGTGRLDTGSVVFVSVALIVRFYQVITRHEHRLPQAWTSYLSVLYVAVYLIDLFLISNSFVTATVHMVLFSMVVKLFSVHRERDNIYLTVLAFLAVLAASVLTVNTAFLISFCLFLLLAVSTFISMEMRRSFAGTAGTSAIEAPSKRRLPGSLALTATILAVAIVSGGMLLFFLLPRFSAGYLSNYAPQNQLVSGFSDHVQLGTIGRIKQSDSVVMHVQFDTDPKGIDLRWRGVALTAFDGKLWSNALSDREELLSPGGRFLLRQAQVARYNLPTNANDLRGSRLLRYRVIMEPIGTNQLFLLPMPVEVFGRFRDISMDDAGTLAANVDSARPIESYQALAQMSMVAAPTSAEAHYPTQIAADYLQLPQIDSRIQPLTEQIVSSATTPFLKAKAIENYLKANMGYTLQLPSAPPADPVANFLFERKAGHCEYFASAMAVMLRAIGIPSRIINGFHTGQYNDVSGTYIVRARDAHSWVEAFIPGTGWMTFDPTPPDPAIVPSDWNRMMLYVDALQEFWREWVINYDFGHQRQLSARAIGEAQRSTDQFRRWANRHYRSLLKRGEELRLVAIDHPTTLIRLGVVVLVGFLFLFSLPRMLSAIRGARLGRDPAKAPQAAASLWYGRMVRVLARRGYKKEPVQTPTEFADTISDLKLRGSVSTFTEHYQRARFGGSGVDAEKLPELYEELATTHQNQGK